MIDLSNLRYVIAVGDRYLSPKGSFVANPRDAGLWTVETGSRHVQTHPARKLISLEKAIRRYRIGLTKKHHNDVCSNE